MEKLEKLVLEKLSQVTEKGRYVIGYESGGDLYWLADDNQNKVENRLFQMFNQSCCNKPPYVIIDRTTKKKVEQDPFW